MFQGRFHPLEPNFPPEPCPLHGNGWLSEWAVVEQTTDRVILELASQGPGAFRYLARTTYALSVTALSVHLEVINHAPAAFPFGLGFHPWFPRTPDMQLQAHAEAIWLEDARHLPTRKISISERPDWNFDLPRPLPANWINNGFDGWNGAAWIEWPSRHLSLAIEGSYPLRSYILYSPSGDAPFFCFEPVSHVVDAHNLPGGPEANGLVTLAPNERMEISCRFSPRLDMSG
jgi:aldose 1-epimerase